jgi:hypothetical protein
LGIVPQAYGRGVGTDGGEDRQGGDEHHSDGW